MQNKNSFHSFILFKKNNSQSNQNQETPCFTQDDLKDFHHKHEKHIFYTVGNVIKAAQQKIAMSKTRYIVPLDLPAQTGYKYKFRKHIEAKEIMDSFTKVDNFKLFRTEKEVSEYANKLVEYRDDGSVYIPAEFIVYINDLQNMTDTMPRSKVIPLKGELAYLEETCFRNKKITLGINYYAVPNLEEQVLKYAMGKLMSRLVLNFLRIPTFLLKVLAL